MAVCADPDLGRVLLDQKPNKGNLGNAIFLMLLGAPMMAVVFAPNAPSDVRWTLFALGAGLVVFGLVMLWRNWMHVYLQERGICEYRQGRRRTLRYDQVDEVIYSSMRILMNGGYIHTIQKLALKSDQVEGGPLVCTTIFKETNSTVPMPVTDVCNQISQRLAIEMMATLDHQPITWTDKVRVHPRGIEHHTARGDWELLEWNRISRHELDQAVFRLWVEGEQQPRLQFSSTIPNFFPIYRVVRSFLN